MDPWNTPLADPPRFAAYVDTLSDALGHADRVAPLKAYCTGLLLPGARKSIEPMAARIAPARVQATHQSLHHFVAKGEWSDTALLARVRAAVLPMIESQGPIQAWIVDDTSFPKKGRHSVGVGRQYCGQVGKQDNCQVAVTLSLANAQASLPVAYRLYLPEAWALDPERRRKAGVPAAIRFQTKPQIALDQIRAAHADKLPPGLVLADAGYGIDTAFRTALTELGLPYSLGIQSSTSLWSPGTTPLPPKPWSGRGRPPTRVRRSPDHKPLSAEKLARSLPEEAWQCVTWRAGTNGLLVSRFAAERVRPAHRDELRHEPRPEEWVLIEWPQGEAAPTKYWLSSLPPETPLTELVSQTKLRWRIERDYQELKQEIGLGHYEGRGWRGFHHHASLCIAAYGFLVSERGRIPPRHPSSSGSKHLSYPPITDPAAPPIRPERHVPDSITTLRLGLTRALLQSLQRCPCCYSPFVTQ
ncbi:IS701 family transposase [Methylobacterium durans]|uniref:IS701 family transposase n=1 Tax=Methylobacterium durans TaxID=2202825 RepID=A0A2U8W752_9HYPH|nr:IS701 family transposase [Methylobacterium durans]